MAKSKKAVGTTKGKKATTDMAALREEMVAKKYFTKMLEDAAYYIQSMDDDSYCQEECIDHSATPGGTTRYVGSDKQVLISIKTRIDDAGNILVNVFLYGEAKQKENTYSFDTLLSATLCREKQVCANEYYVDVDINNSILYKVEHSITAPHGLCEKDVKQVELESFITMADKVDKGDYSPYLYIFKGIVEMLNDSIANLQEISLNRQNEEGGDYLEAETEYNIHKHDMGCEEAELFAAAANLL